MEPLAFLSRMFVPYKGMGLKAELRSLHKQSNIPKSLFYSIDTDLERMSEVAIYLAKRWNVYYGVLPRGSNVGSKESITCSKFLYCEIDGKSDGVPGAYRLLRIAMENGLPAPHTLVNSGGGLHIYYELSEMINLRDNIEKLKFESVLRRLAYIVGGVRWDVRFENVKLIPVDGQRVHADPTCCELARILRVPGTINHKPQRLCKVSMAHVQDYAPKMSLIEWNRLLPQEPLPRTVRQPIRKKITKPILDGPIPLPPSTLQAIDNYYSEGQKYPAIRSIVYQMHNLGWDEYSIRLIGQNFCSKHRCDYRPVEQLITNTIRKTPTLSDWRRAR